MITAAIEPESGSGALAAGGSPSPRSSHRASAGSRVGTAGECMNEYRRRQRRAKRPPGYGAMHARITKLRGPARQYRCWESGERQAMDWAFAHDDPEPVIGKWKNERVIYSIDIMRY